MNIFKFHCPACGQRIEAEGWPDWPRFPMSNLPRRHRYSHAGKETRTTPTGETADQTARAGNEVPTRNPGRFEQASPARCAGLNTRAGDAYWRSAPNAGGRVDARDQIGSRADHS